MFGNPINKINNAVAKNNEKTLIKFAQSKDKEIQTEAIKGLGLVSGEDSTNFLLSSLRTPDPEIRKEVAISLGNKGQNHAREFLSQQLKVEKNEEVASALKESMKKLSSLSE